MDVVTLFPRKENEAQAVTSSGADAAPADCTLRCLRARTLALWVEVGGRRRSSGKWLCCVVYVVHVRVFALRYASLRSTALCYAARTTHTHADTVRSATETRAGHRCVT